MSTTTAAPTSYAVYPAKSDDLCVSVYTLAEALAWITTQAPPGTYDVLGYVPVEQQYRRVKSIKKGG